MIKRLIIWTLVIVIFLSTLVYLGINIFVPIVDYREPGRFGSYPEGGMYTYDSNTILESLGEGELDAFTPYLGDPDDIELYYDPITWSESDYLKFANTLSQKVWGKSLDPVNWNIESVYFSQSCTNNPKGFNQFHIVYYEDLGITGWKRGYSTRLIDIQPWRGLVYWGGNAIFSSTLVARWKNIGLERFVTSADGALQIAEKYGGNKTDKRHCSTISVSMYQHDKESWDINYFPTSFGMYVDANNGTYKVLRTDQ